MAKYEKYDWSGVYDSKNFLCGFGSPWSERCNCSRRSDNFGFLCCGRKKPAGDNTADDEDTFMYTNYMQGFYL